MAALAVGAFDVGAEHRYDLIGVRGDVGDEDDRYVAGVGALGCVFECASGARLGGGERALLGVSIPVDLLGDETAFGTRCFEFNKDFGLGGEGGMCAVASFGSQRTASE